MLEPTRYTHARLWTKQTPNVQNSHSSVNIVPNAKPQSQRPKNPAPHRHLGPPLCGCKVTKSTHPWKPSEPAQNHDDPRPSANLPKSSDAIFEIDRTFVRNFPVQPKNTNPTSPIRGQNRQSGGKSWPSGPNFKDSSFSWIAGRQRLSGHCSISRRSPSP